MANVLIHTVTNCTPELVPSPGTIPRYKLRSHLFDTEEQARDFIANRPHHLLSYCAQWWSVPWSFDEFLHTDHRLGD